MLSLGWSIKPIIYFIFKNLAKLRFEWLYCIQYKIFFYVNARNIRRKIRYILIYENTRNNKNLLIHENTYTTIIAANTCIHDIQNFNTQVKLLPRIFIFKPISMNQILFLRYNCFSILSLSSCGEISVTLPHFPSPNSCKVFFNNHT